MRACALHASPTQIGSAKKAESVNLGCHWGSEVRAELIQGIVKDLRNQGSVRCDRPCSFDSISCSLRAFGDQGAEKVHPLPVVPLPTSSISHH
jgi:hypothetical protein